MRKFASVVVILAIAAIPLAFAGEAKAKGKAMTHDVTTEIVSMDLEKHTITLMGPEGENITAPVKGEALASLKSKKLKAGDKVVATCQDDEQGNHQAVTDLKPAKA